MSAIRTVARLGRWEMNELSEIVDVQMRPGITMSRERRFFQISHDVGGRSAREQLTLDDPQDFTELEALLGARGKHVTPDRDELAQLRREMIERVRDLVTLVYTKTQRETFVEVQIAPELMAQLITEEDFYKSRNRSDPEIIISPTSVIQRYDYDRVMNISRRGRRR